ncbi:hypothetical protein PQU92_05110 [Asticcacaulis sp. BYS171W]|uniref:Uncharacterized protein n=1 Tax=Asticcacaulis aquaticus TaxID=2984212 RepID=A0ABT5HRT0_9CAUL|nr:hypothetical protein [Asticcacaulis aquaticus]MDC7682643.1 hypothetical protein [Asticcacaulis aquaticus]
MKYLRWMIAIIVLAYAGWIAFPVVKNALTPTYDPSVPTRQADDTSYRSGPTITASDDAYGADVVVPTDSIQGETAVAAIETDNKPVIWLWAGVVVFYLLSAFLLAKGNLRAGLAYGAAFVADVTLTYLTKGEAGSGLFDKILETLSGWDPRYTLTLVALVLGFIVLMARGRPLPKRHLVME